MRPCTKMSSLRNGRTRPDRDRPQRVEDRPIPHRALRAEVKVPGNNDADSRKNMHIRPDIGPEKPQ